MTVSGGVATYPTHGAGRDELIRLADSALYWAKEDGKNRVRAYAAESFLRANLEQLADSPDRAARTARRRASRRRSTRATRTTAGTRSASASYAARIARRLGADEPTIELIRLGGSLHDLGKLAIPEELLRKPTTLSDAERLVLERHPQIGYRMLESLGVEPVAECVLHHHERWDGTGYPDKLAGEQIPLAARIVFVADAYDAMTAARGRTAAASRSEEALAELERCAGTQFDPASSRPSATSYGRRATTSSPFRGGAAGAGDRHGEEATARVPGSRRTPAEGDGRHGSACEEHRPQEEDRRQLEPVERVTRSLR